MSDCPEGGDHDPEDLELDEEDECILAVCSKCGLNILYDVMWEQSPSWWTRYP